MTEKERTIFRIMQESQKKENGLRVVAQAWAGALGYLALNQPRDFASLS